MSRRLEPGCRLLVATHNAGKLREIQALLSPYNMEAVSAGALSLPVPAETGNSFIANAEIKAHAGAEGAQLPALSDDSGLVVPAMDGAPGIYSADWAGPNRDFALAMQKLNVALTETGHHTTGTEAYFVCALALAWPDGYVTSFEGRVYGTLLWPPRGTRGFGYDPMFKPAGHDFTFGEMDPDLKHAISHRADAFTQFKASCLPR